ncbi:hypothetical protein L596_028698 [Steinernema carpocapsae]|uniref:Uncharacterized protein n=1 Tax=Steinernema carpocapsae TaxID=34508 RepID=A0A4U5LZ75_STECR|nr:hypothetical protein L596_028698 [Steinernema carpocapsae]
MESGAAGVSGRFGSTIGSLNHPTDRITLNDGSSKFHVQSLHILPRTEAVGSSSLLAVPAMFAMFVVLSNVFTFLFVLAPSGIFCAFGKAKTKRPPISAGFAASGDRANKEKPQEKLTRYKPGHIPNFADGLDLIEDDTLYEVKTETALPDKEDQKSSGKSSKPYLPSESAIPPGMGSPKL